MKLDIVVARYKEDIGWLVGAVEAVRQEGQELLELGQELQVQMYVYDKGNEEHGQELLHLLPLKHLEASGVGVHIERLENVGRESHTYMHHVRTHYPRYQESKREPHYVLFLQGSISDHAHIYAPGGDSVDIVRNLVRDAIQHPEGRSASFARDYQVGWNGAHYRFKIGAHVGQAQAPTHECLGEWFERCVRPQFPQPCLWWMSGLFCVRADVIAAKPQAYYANLHSCLDTVKHHAPEVGHFFERSWYYIFSTDNADNAVNGGYSRGSRRSRRAVL